MWREVWVKIHFFSYVGIQGHNAIYSIRIPSPCFSLADTFSINRVTMCVGLFLDTLLCSYRVVSSSIFLAVSFILQS